MQRYNINIYKTNFNYSIYLKISSLLLHNIQRYIRIIYSSKWRFNLDRSQTLKISIKAYLLILNLLGKIRTVLFSFIYCIVSHLTSKVQLLIIYNKSLFLSYIVLPTFVLELTLQRCLTNTLKLCIYCFSYSLNNIGDIDLILEEREAFPALCVAFLRLFLPVVYP